jgi:hypothetical protein
MWSFPSGGSVNAGAIVVDGTVYWGSGYGRLGFVGGKNKFYACRDNHWPSFSWKRGAPGRRHMAATARGRFRGIRDRAGNINTNKAKAKVSKPVITATNNRSGKLRCDRIYQNVLLPMATWRMHGLVGRICARQPKARSI